MHYYKGTYIRVSPAASRYLTDFRRVGRYVYVTEYNEQAVQKLMASKTLISQVLNTLSDNKRIGISVGEFLKAAAKHEANCGQMRRATHAELQAYKKVRARYFQEWLAHELKHQAERTKRVARFEAQLANPPKNTKLAQLRRTKGWLAYNKRAIVSGAKRIAYCQQMLGIDQQATADREAANQAPAIVADAK